MGKYDEIYDGWMADPEGFLGRGRRLSTGTSPMIVGL